MLYVLENSIKFSPPAATIKIRQFVDGDFLLFEIEDAGKGVDVTEMEGIFDLFNLNDIEHHGSGVGVSLALSRLIVEAHGGELSVCNAEVGGAIFTLSLPWPQKKPAQLQAGA